MPETRDDGIEQAPAPAPERGDGGVTDAAASVAPVTDAAASAAPQATTLPAVAPTDTGWLRVSPKYLVVEIIGSIIGMIVFVGGLLVIYFLWQWPWALWGAIALGVVSLLGIAFEPRRVRSIAYRLREDDLLFKRGIMYQRQVAVPYGRMQLVDITRGPVARALGLADLKFVTAAASTAVTVPGLPMEEADRLRDELVALAETRRAGL